MLKRLIFLLISCLYLYSQSTICHSQEANIYMPNAPIRIIMVTSGQPMLFEYLHCEIEPVCKEERIFIPIRSFGEYFNYDISWNDYSQTVTVTGNGHQNLFTLNCKEAVMDNENMELVDAPFIKDDRTMVPIRSIAEIWGLDVKWIAGLDNVQYVWLSDVALLDDSDLEITAQDYSIVQEGDLFSRYKLNPTGATKRGIRLGDCCEKVLDLYGKPSQTGNDATELIWGYTIPVLPYTDEVGTLTFYIYNELVTCVELETIIRY